MKRNFFRKWFIAGVLAAAVLTVNAVIAQTLPAGVQDVIKLKQAGLSDDLILSQIRNSGTTYNLTADQIVDLKTQGISETVIKALISGSDSSPAPAATPEPPPTTPPPAPTPEPTPAPAVATPPLTPPPGNTPPTVGAPPPGQPVASFDSFQAQLSPYGNWIQVPGYGLCWQPSVAISDPVWRPYLDSGHWIYTDDGWYWQSDYPWGDIAFHYGRWFRLNGIWTWLPGYNWAPAWVTWREADGYSGWAPLPPAAVYRPGVGLYYDGRVAVDVDFGLGPDDFTFVPYGHFWDHHLRPFFVPRDRDDFFFHHSRVMNGYRMDHGHFRVEGLGRDHMFGVTHHDFRIEHEPRGRFDYHDGRDFRDGRDHGYDHGYDGGHDDGHDGGWHDRH